MISAIKIFKWVFPELWDAPVLADTAAAQTNASPAPAPVTTVLVRSPQWSTQEDYDHAFTD